MLGLRIPVGLECDGTEAAGRTGAMAAGDEEQKGWEEESSADATHVRD
jgi:hypothetical protein